MRLIVRTNAAQVSRTMRRIFADQLPFAAAKAINDTAKEAQSRQRAGMADRFTIRRPSFVNRAVKIKPFANKRHLSATIQIEPPGGQQRADILTRHEEAHEREPRSGQALVVPLEIRPNIRAVVKKRDRPKAFAFTHVRTTSGGVQIYEGRRRTFMVRMPDGSGWILQRTGPGRWGSLFHGTRVLYVLRPTVPIEARLEFIATITKAVDETFPRNFERAFARAMKTAR